MFVAIAAQFGSSDIIHVELNQRRLMDVWVREVDLAWRRLDLTASNWWTFRGKHRFKCDVDINYHLDSLLTDTIRRGYCLLFAVRLLNLVSSACVCQML